jgi:coenzyme PQQ precursor peptide PqqA
VLPDARRRRIGTDIAYLLVTAGMRGHAGFASHPGNRHFPQHYLEETTMEWTKPEFSDWRFGFEITMYVANR